MDIPGLTCYTEEEILKTRSAPQSGQPLWQKLQALEFKGSLVGYWTVSLPLGSLPFSLSSFLCSILEAGGRLEGEMAGPRDSQDSPSLRCHGNMAIFIPLFMMLKALTFSAPERPGWLLPSSFNATPSPGGLRGEKRNGGSQNPVGHPSTRGTV